MEGLRQSRHNVVKKTPPKYPPAPQKLQREASGKVREADCHFDLAAVQFWRLFRNVRSNPLPSASVGRANRLLINFQEIAVITNRF